MDQQDLNLPLDETLIKIGHKHWLLEYKALNISVLLLIAAIIALIVINTGNGAINKANISTSKIAKNNPVATWKNTYGNILTALENDINNVDAQVANQSYTALEPTCQQLQTDTASTANIPVIPNTLAAAQFSNAVTTLQQAATNCINGSNIYLNQADNDNPPLERQAVDELNNFNTELDNGTTDLQTATTTINSQAI